MFELPQDLIEDQDIAITGLKSLVWLLLKKAGGSVELNYLDMEMLDDPARMEISVVLSVRGDRTYTAITLPASEEQNGSNSRQ